MDLITKSSDLLKQCQTWQENKEYQKLIDALENIPVEEHAPEIDSELAKAYIAIADPGEREPYEKALEACPGDKDIKGVHRRLPPSFVPASV